MHSDGSQMTSRSKREKYTNIWLENAKEKDDMEGPGVRQLYEVLRLYSAQYADIAKSLLTHIT
jgi:hypothetical protein